MMWLSFGVGVLCGFGIGAGLMLWRLGTYASWLRDEARWAMQLLHYYLPPLLDTEALRVHDRVTAFFKRVNP